MTNPQKDYHILVTLPNAYGEEADIVVDDLEKILNDPTRGGWTEATVEHLTPETLPDRYKAVINALLDGAERTQTDLRSVLDISDEVFYEIQRMAGVDINL